MNASVPIVSIVLGAVLLLFGRRLFWLCVAALGFAAGVEFAPNLVHEPTPVLQLSIAVVLGFIGALLAVFLQRIAIAIAGFIAGARLAVALAAAFFTAPPNYYWITFIVGGVIGAILLLSVFNWALIVLSSLVGAYLIDRAITLPPTGATLVLVALFIVGVLAQAAAFRRRPVEAA